MKRRSFLQGLVATIVALPTAAILARAPRVAQPQTQISISMDDVLRTMIMHDIMRHQDMVVLRQLGCL